MNEANNRNIYHIMEIKVAQISARYILCKQVVEEKSNKVSSGEKDESSVFCDYIERVEAALNSLEDANKEIILKDFFYQNTYNFWWESCYSKSSYYRIKNAAMKKFLRTFANA